MISEDNFLYVRVFSWTEAKELGVVCEVCGANDENLIRTKERTQILIQALQRTEREELFQKAT